jgi:signal transduction histidine kinase
VEGDVQTFIGGRNLPPEIVAELEYLTDETNSARPILVGEVSYILHNDVQADLPEFREPPHNYINSWMAVPLKVKGKIIGLIALDGMKKNQFSGRHVELAVTYADQVAIALENSLLFADLQQQLTLRKNLIAELESKNAELERFTYTVSHDLKSPLVTINGFLGYLEIDAKTGNMQRLRNDIKRIQEAVNKMRRLLDELLELSRVGRLVNTPQIISFADLVKDSLDIVHGQLQERGVAVNIQPDLPTVFGDRQRLVEVLQNLIDNAIKFMGDEQNPQIEIGQLGEDNGRPVFFVKDNGIGIAPKYHEQVFGLFNRLNQDVEGTGIGLALVKRIVEVHGGRIWIESEAGKGSTFYFTLGRVDAE